jgi:hypothetical protein
MMDLGWEKDIAGLIYCRIWQYCWKEPTHFTIFSGGPSSANIAERPNITKTPTQFEVFNNLSATRMTSYFKIEFSKFTFLVFYLT